ncbi:MAG: isoprenylcysteine carboxylmethyltransferase family protein [Acidobacteriia bacterium]|nr:isoprenylcysteine carboxylmethyltransferase family protein [Terriglobia bacterium]
MTWSRIARRIRVPLGFAFAALYLWRARPTWISLAAGGLIALIGIAIRAVASGHISKNSELTTSGPYAYTRNPLYLGSIVIALGFAVAALSWWIALALVVLFVAIYIPVILAEESFLRSRFSEFDQYARQVPRLLPRLRPHTTSAGSFSRQRYLQHREYNALIGTAVMIAALVAKLLWAGR